jgi:hypothetical protein
MINLELLPFWVFLCVYGVVLVLLAYLVWLDMRPGRTE